MAKEVLALIPARGGSKSIPRKNIRPFAGHPLIAYSIAAGLQAERVTRVIVSTDDEEIAAIARQYGAETPFLRPAEYSQDHTADLPVFQHALRWLAEQQNYHPEIVVQLRPTSPLRRVAHIDQAVTCLIRASRSRRHPHGMYPIPEPLQNVANRAGWFHVPVDREPGCGSKNLRALQHAATVSARGVLADRLCRCSLDSYAHGKAFDDWR